MPYSDALAEKTEQALAIEIAAGHPQGGRAADFGTGEGGVIDAVEGIHHANDHAGDVRRRSLDGRRFDGGPRGRRWRVVHAAASATNAAEGRTIED